MKILLKGRFLNDIKPLLIKKGFELVTENPDLIITYGGDGTLLGAEREYPGIPKLPIRDSRTAFLCPNHTYDQLFDDLENQKLSTKELIKISGKIGDKEIIGINDIFIHNSIKVSAIRYRIWIDNKLYFNEAAGDCFGVATPHGSTAYFRSITKCVFRVGLGMAFSNSREKIDNIIVPIDAVIKVQLLRGPAFMVADNDPKVIELTTGDIFTISTSSEKAVIHGLDMFMCPQCRKLRHLKI